MGLSITRQNQLIGLFDVLVEKAIESLGYRKAAMNALKSRPTYKVWTETRDRSDKLIAELNDEVEKRQKEMDKIQSEFQKVTGGKINFHDFMEFHSFKEAVAHPEIKEANGEILLVTDDTTERSYNTDKVIDREKIGPPEFLEFIEGLRADLKLSLTERELVAAIAKAKEEITKYIQEHK